MVCWVPMILMLPQAAAVNDIRRVLGGGGHGQRSHFFVECMLRRSVLCDLKSAHDSFSRPKTIAVLKEAALSSKKHAMLFRVWHAMML